MLKNKLATVILTAFLTIFGFVVTPAAFSAPAPRPTPPPKIVQHSSVKVLDSAGTINSQSWFNQAYRDGFRLYIMHSTAWGTCDPWYNTENQLRMAVKAGLKIAVYTRNPQCWQNGILATRGFQSQLQFFALDVELGGPTITREMVDGIKGMNVRPVIYTGSGMWPQMTNNSTAFSDVPLWDTDARSLNYSRWSANYLAPTPVAYGGWNTPSTMRVGVQQKFNQQLNGIAVDLNSFDATFLK